MNTSRFDSDLCRSNDKAELQGRTEGYSLSSEEAVKTAQTAQRRALQSSSHADQPMGEGYRRSFAYRIRHPRASVSALEGFSPFWIAAKAASRSFSFTSVGLLLSSMPPM